ncbi:MAG: hypothetical protein FJ255_12390 [Phycisphaerae bacterium]|nr:hypothetical protein [Phycisphaerae bacterium]
MPKLKYHAFDRAVFDDSYPFPQRQIGLAKPRLVGAGDSITHAEAALDSTQRRLDNLKALLDDGFDSDPDHPRAA